MVSTKELRFISLGIGAAGFGPLVGGTLFYLIRGELHLAGIQETLGIALAVYPFAVAFACIFGLPLFFLARHFHMVRWWSAVCCGLLVGCAVQFIVLPGALHIENIALYAADGVASSLLFFTTWRRGAHA